MKYKRNQIEEAISRLFGEKSAKPSPGLQTRVKRLLDLDRSLPLNTDSSGSGISEYAFYSSEPPGKGIEVFFSIYEAFALMIGLQMLNHSWPQKFVVDTLRRLRRDLQRQHKKIVGLNPETLFDEEKIANRAKAGSLAVNSGSPLFLLIWSDQRQASDPAPTAGVFNEEGAFKVVKEKVGRSCTWLEITRPAQLLSVQLSTSLPRKRGRS